MVPVLRKSRIDASGALHYIIVRRIERRKIFLDDPDRNNFIDRVSGIVGEKIAETNGFELLEEKL